MENLGVRKTYDGRGFSRNAAEDGRSASSICQRRTTKARNRVHRWTSQLRSRIKSLQHRETLEKSCKACVRSHYCLLRKDKEDCISYSTFYFSASEISNSLNFFLFSCSLLNSSSDIMRFLARPTTVFLVRRSSSFIS